MKIFFIGTGAGGSSGSNRWRASALVMSNGSLVLVDCGVGCHYRLSERGLLRELDLVYITHYHMDHFLGLPELMFQAHLEGRKKHLQIYGPEGIENMIRTVAPHLFTNINFTFSVEKIKPLTPIKLNQLILTPFTSCHVTESYGLRIDEAGGVSVGFSSDTSEPCYPLLESLKGVKVLVHEATCDERNKELCHKYGHSTVLEAIEAAKRIGAQKLILNHIDENFNDIKLSYTLAKQHLGDDVVFANDLDTYILD